MSTERSRSEPPLRRVEAEAEAEALGLSRTDYLTRADARWLADLDTPRAVAALSALLADVHGAAARPVS
jgi:hypothetical protein